jgi:hypothetical protein
VASIFVILFGASLFGLLTLRFKSADGVFPRLMRAFSGGIILALALVHIIPEVRSVRCQKQSLTKWRSTDHCSKAFRNSMQGQGYYKRTKGRLPSWMVKSQGLLTQHT